MINITLINIFPQASCKRFVSQLLNLALRAAKKYDERETVTWMNQIAKYTVFISSAVDADGNLFKEVSDVLVTHTRRIHMTNHYTVCHIFGYVTNTITNETHWNSTFRMSYHIVRCHIVPCHVMLLTP